MLLLRNLRILGVRYAAWNSRFSALRLQCDQCQPKAKAEVGQRAQVNIRGITAP